MNKALISIFSIVLMIGMALGATGSFGEVASLNACHCLMFNSTTKTNIWTLHNGFNTSIKFAIIKPNMTDVVITTLVMNGTIQPNSYYPINVTVVSNNSPVNQSGYMTAYVVSNTTGNATRGASIRLGTAKLLKIAANTAITGGQSPLQQTPQSGNSNQSTKSTTTLPNPTTPQTTQMAVTQNGNSLIQGAGNISAAASALSLVPYLIIAVILLLVVIGALLYHITGKKRKRYSR